MYAADNLLTHPLVSPLSAPISAWEGSPPVYINTGTELLSDEDRYVATAISKAGAVVVYEEYETMPHCFAMVIETLPASRKFFDAWTSFMDAAVHRRETLSTNGKKIKPKTLMETAVVVEDLSKEDEEGIERQMKRRVGEMNGSEPDPMAKL